MITIPSLNNVTDILDTDMIMVTQQSGQSYKIAGSELNKRGKIIIANSTTITGAPLKAGSSVRVYFTVDLTAANASTILQLNYNNVNCYLMDGTIKGDKLAKMMSESGQDVDQASAENLKNMDFDTSIYFRANDETPYAIEIDLGKAIEGVLAAQSQQMQEIQGLDISAEEMKVKVIFNAFNNVKEISVPEDVKKSAIEGDATFDMQDFMGVDGI